MRATPSQVQSLTRGLNILEALARASSVIAVIVSVHTSLVSEPIAQFGSEAQKQLGLPRLASGESIGAFALSEEQA